MKWALPLVIAVGLMIGLLIPRPGAPVAPVAAVAGAPAAPDAVHNSAQPATTPGSGSAPVEQVEQPQAEPAPQIVPDSVAPGGTSMPPRDSHGVPPPIS